MTEPTQRRLAAIVSVDVVGYSRLMGVDEVGTLKALKNHRAELIDAKITEHGGRIVKTMRRPIARIPLSRQCHRMRARNPNSHGRPER